MRYNLSEGNLLPLLLLLLLFRFLHDVSLPHRIEIERRPPVSAEGRYYNFDRDFRILARRKRD